MNQLLLENITVEPKVAAKASVIWLHGLGADGHDFANVLPELDLPVDFPARFIFPHAPIQPVTLNGGMHMRAWFDIYGLTFGVKQDEKGIRQAQAAIEQLIAHEIEKGIPAHKIILAGFSQGGALALHSGLRYPQRLAGIMGLSTVLPLAEKLSVEVTEVNRNVPIFLAHGLFDSVIEIGLAEMTRDVLTQLNYEVNWYTYPLAHGVCLEEIHDIKQWLMQVLR